MKQPLSISILLTLLMSMVGLCASAHDFEAGGIYYVYNDGANGSSVSVSYRGDSYYEYADEYSGSLTIFPSVTYNGKTFSVTSIGSLAFWGCSGLTSVTIPSSVTSIGSAAFKYCSGLTSIYVDSQNRIYDSRGNCNAIISISDNTLIAGCKNTIIPKSVTSIGSSAFEDCSGLTSVTIPSSVTSIGSAAFAGCSGLTSVTIPSSVTSIGSHAFFNCGALFSVIVDIREPLSISSDAFSNYANATLTVPFGRKKTYETADYWKDFKEIVEMPMSEADIASNTILPWGAQQAWEMKYMFFDGTDSEPAADGSGHAWYEEEYDDESWETLSGPIANISDWFSSVNTLWNTEGHESSSYCLRRTFHLDEVDEQGYTFLSQHDDALKVWLNGELVVDADHDGTLHCHHIPASAFHEGDNTLAISVNDFGGEAYLDYSLGHLFFLKNVETEKYLSNGNAYNTHAVLADEPLPVSLNKQDDGSYTIFFPVGSVNSRMLFMDESMSDVYVDYAGQEAPACHYWTITDAGNGNYHIQVRGESDTYLGNDPDWEPDNDVDGDVASDKNITWTLELEGLHTAAQAERLQQLIAQANDLHIDTQRAQAVLDNQNATYTEMLAQILQVDVWINEGIWFENEKVKELCVARWDTSKDGELSRLEAAAVTDLGDVFKGNTEITKFNELQFFIGLTSIGDEAFEGCSSLESVELPEGLLRIGGCIDGGAFHGSGLTSIKFPSTVTSVGHAAFQGCNNLTSIDFNGCTATLEGDAFSWCSSLEEVYIPNTITLTGYFTFACCEKLKTVIFEEGNPTEGIFFTFWGEYTTSQLETVVLPSTAIMGDGMFTNCINLESVTFLSGEPGEKHFANNFQGCPDDVLFTIPEGTAESYLNRGYHNLSDKGALSTVKGLFEDQAGRILNEMASSVADGDKDVLNAAIGEAREIVEAAEDYMTIYQQIDAIKDAAKAYLATATLSTLTEDLDVTGAMITNPDNDYFDIGWTIGFLGVNNGWQGAYYYNEDCIIGSFVEGWRPSEVLSDGRHWQTIKNLPVGKYRLEAKAIATWGDDPEQEVTGVSLFIGDQSTPVATANEKPQFFSVEFTNAEAQDVEIGLMVENTTANWVALDDVRLYRLSEDNVL
ncbi:MAG: leucine-rich repeat domain-containing protein [Prevotella sp.]|nr:leucine-rich repeat domain-containing protein [Prevotella sp.]